MRDPAAAILSFVGLGGIGFEIDLALDDLRFERVCLVALSAIIVGAGAISARIRARLAG